MRKYKVSKKDFERIFTRRDLTWRERYLQDFWFIEVEECWHVLEQRSNKAGVAFALIGSILVSPALFVYGGVKDLKGFWCEIIIHVTGSPVRSDDCVTGATSTRELIKLAGWG